MIRVFVATGCPYCERLLADLARRRVAAEVVDLRVEPERVEEVFALTWDRRVPVVVDHERFSIGFNGSTALADLGLGATYGQGRDLPR